MPRRPALATAAALSTLLLTTACQPSSPEAGQPNTTPIATGTTPTAKPTVTSPATPAWTPKQQAAITAAKARYAVAMAAIDRTFMNPAGIDRPTLEKAGISGEWIITIVDQARTLERNGLYVTGRVTIATSAVTSVNLQQEQPEVVFLNCLDYSKQVMRYKSSGKPAQSAPGTETRRQVASHLRFAPSLAGKKMWFFITDEDKGPC